MQTGLQVMHPCHGRGVVVGQELDGPLVRFETGYRGPVPENQLVPVPVKSRKQVLDPVQEDKAVMALLIHLLE